MPAFSFEALDADGRTARGVVEADTARAARGLLRARGLVPLGVDTVANGAFDADGGRQGLSLTMTLWRSRVFNAAALAIWTRQLAGLVSAGLPLERALTALADEAEDDRQRGLVASLRAEVNAGSSFAKALAHYPREFAGIYVAVVGAGEQSGHLGLVLERLATDLE